jgi:hypothetical protein
MEEEEKIGRGWLVLFLLLRLRREKKGRRRSPPSLPTSINNSFDSMKKEMEEERR